MSIRKISAFLLSSSVLCAANAFAAGQEYTANLSKGYDLNPHEQQTINGNWLSSRTLNCQVRAKAGEANPISMIALKKRVIVNGMILTEGNSMSVLVHLGDTIYFELDSRGKLGLINNGEQLVNLKCS